MHAHRQQVVQLLRTSGDYALQANITEIIFRLKLSQRQMTALFKQFGEHSNTISEKFKDIGRKGTDFLQGVRAFVNIVNELQGDERW